MRGVSFAAAAAVTLVFVSGCINLAPEHQRPAAPVPDVWPVNPQQQGTALAADLDWRAFFIDERIRHLIELALQHNRDLRVAALNIEKARAQYQIERSALFPSIDANAAGTRQRIPETLSTTGGAYTNSEYTASLGFAAYELDLFGRLRNLKAQALEQYLATTEARRSAQISLVSAVASAWLTLTADRERLQLAHETLASQRKSYELIQRSFEVGIATELDLRRAQSSVDSAQVDIASYTTLVAQDLNALSLLVGRPVAEEGEKLSLRDITRDMPQPLPGLPAEILLRRPDILRAEHDLRAATANIGAARAAFFPSITLTAGAGTASTKLSDLFSAGTGTWNFMPQINLPIFNAGRNKANLAVAQVDREILLAQYEQSIQIAFREVADALAIRSTIDTQLVAQQSLTDASEKIYQLSEARYRQGVESYLGVLDAQRSYYNAQQTLIATRLSQATNLVTLYKVLGGGWQASTGLSEPLAGID
ncbi:MAG: efflux transporter outer membrane subunit [Anaerolineae bacterium]